MKSAIEPESATLFEKFARKDLVSAGKDGSGKMGRRLRRDPRAAAEQTMAEDSRPRLREQPGVESRGIGHAGVLRGLGPPFADRLQRCLVVLGRGHWRGRRCGDS